MDQQTTLRARIPNALTILRLIAVAIFVALLSRPDPSRALLLTATALFVAAALTDALDGYLARRWSVISRFGRVMDPLADKVLVLGAFVCLAGPAFVQPTQTGDFVLITGVEPWITVLILARELLITSLRGLIESGGEDFSASLTGKLKMIAQSLAVPVILLIVAVKNPVPGDIAHRACQSIAIITALITAVSAIPYIRRAITSGAAQ